MTPVSQPTQPAETADAPEGTSAGQALVDAVNKALTEAVTGAEKCRGQPSFAGIRPEWDDGYVAGIKCAAMIVQAAMLNVARTAPTQPTKDSHD